MNGRQEKLTVKPSEVGPILDFAITHGFNIMLVGAPGIGKTYMVNQSTKRLLADLEVFYTSTMDPTYPGGYPYPKKSADGTADVADFLLYGQMDRLMNATKTTVAFLDDFGQATPAVQAAFMNPLQVKIVNGRQMPDCVRWVIATNRKEDGAGVSGILEPIKSRMHIILHIEPDLEDFLAWWLAEDLPVEIYAYLKTHPDRLQDFKPTKDILAYPCPRSWENAGKIMKAHRAAGGDLNVLMYLLAGAVGTPDALALIQFIKMISKAVNPDSVIKNPDTATVPEDTTVLLGLISALIYRLDGKNAKAILRYANRLPVEFAGKLRVDILAKSKREGLGIENTAEYGDLIRYTGNILMS